MESEPPKKDLERSIAEYCVSFSLSDVPSDVRDKARLVVVDTVGVCIRGAEVSYIGNVVRIYETFGGNGGPLPQGATVFATEDRRSPLTAALANAAGGTGLELDEGNQRSGHLGIHVVPPALAVAERLGASGEEFLEAVILGYEVSARLGNVNRPLKDGLHPHGEWSPVGPAVAMGRLLNFGVQQYVEAMRIATNPFLSCHWSAAYAGATVRNFYTGLACQHGMQAAFLAASGVDGVEQSFVRCLLPSTAARDVTVDMLRDVYGDLGNEFYLSSSYFKVHASCRYAHAPIEALASLVRKHDIEPEDVQRITVRTYDAATQLDCTEPQNALSAKFSIPFVLAARLIYGSSGVDVFSDAVLFDERVRTLAKCVRLVSIPEFDERAEEGMWGATVEIALSESRTVSETVPDARGGGDNPFTPEEVKEKFHRLVEDSGSEVDSEALLEDLLSVEKLGDMRDLF